jgi:hypothetical protein
MMISSLITSITFNVQYNTCNFPSIIFCVAISLNLTNKPYVYSFSYTYEFSQIN